jgi:hypothetical protein
MSAEHGSFVTSSKDSLIDILDEACDLVRTLDSLPDKGINYERSHFERILRNVVAAVTR